MRVLDLFAGAGGFSAGLHAAGHELVGAVEFDRDAAATYRAMLADDVIERDICRVGLWELPDCDLVVGGPPCQGWSVAGKQDRNDPRNRLWHEMLRVVAGKRPAWVVIENVRGMLSAGEDKVVVHEFRKIGYHVSVYLLNAADFGVPQRRYRVFYIGNRIGAANPVPQQTHAKPPGHLMFGWQPWVTVRQALGVGSDIAPSGAMTTGGNRHGSPANPTHGGIQHWVEVSVDDADVALRILDTPALTLRASKKGPNGFSIEHRHMAGYVPTGVSHGRASLDETAPTVKGGGVRDHTGKVNGPTPPMLMVHMNDDEPARSDGHWLADDFEYAPTIQTDARVSTPGHHGTDTPRMGWRRLTVNETAILQDFPDWYVFSGSMTSQYRQIGNAVPGGLAKAIGLALIDQPLT